MTGYGTSSSRARGNAGGMAIASLVLGIVGLFFLGIILGILAIVFGYLALKQASRNGMAKAGLILGVVDVVFAVVMMFVSGFGLYVGA
ncbi:DUF4190 domain-containing protein [Streptomyces sp. NPDC049954]|uniref:DUF4190 domain-containing protein n=1 Tax=Streptomyces sp. NPDC049954 TaxID=3155779 RepID=UPI003429C9F2